jgi:hypothetical protein
VLSNTFKLHVHIVFKLFHSVGSQIEQRGQSGAEAGRSAVRTVCGGGADGPRARRVS